MSYKIEVGDWIVTNYNTGPYLVIRISPMDKQRWFEWQALTNPAFVMPEMDLTHLLVIDAKTWISNGQKEIKGDNQYSYLNGYYPVTDCWLNYLGRDKIVRVSVPEGVRAGQQLSIF